MLCWTGLPGLVALVEFIIYIFTSTERLQEKYTGSRGGVVIAIIACGMAFIAFIGILAAIAIPNFIQYRNRAYQATVVAELQNLMVAETEFFTLHDKYSDNLEELNFNVGDSKIIIEIVRADNNCFEAIGKHQQLEEITTIDCNGLK